MLEQRVAEWTHNWKQQGIQQGILKERKDRLREELEDRFGNLPKSLSIAIERLSDAVLVKELTRVARQADSLQAFARQLPEA